MEQKYIKNIDNISQKNNKKNQINMYQNLKQSSTMQIMQVQKEELTKEKILINGIAVKSLYEKKDLHTLQF